MTSATTAGEILDNLRRRHEHRTNGLSRAWIYAEELRIATGFTRIGTELVFMDPVIAHAGEQRIDAFALHTWPSQRFQRVAYEVKTTRSDLTRELNQPHKAAAALALSNMFYLVVGPELGEVLDDFELPDEWGTMVSYPPSRSTDGRIRIRTRSPWRDTPTPPYSFMLSLARNLQGHD